MCVPRRQSHMCCLPGCASLVAAMDLITQIQTYVQTLSTLFAHTLEHLAVESPSVPATENADSSFSGDSVEEKANMLFKRLAEADVLMGSLPSKLATEQEQLETIKKLETLNTAAGDRLAKAQQDAGSAC